MEVFDQMGAAMQRGMSADRAVHLFLDLPQGIKRLLRHRNAFHTRAAHVRARADHSRLRNALRFALYAILLLFRI